MVKWPMLTEVVSTGSEKVTLKVRSPSVLVPDASSIVLSVGPAAR